MINMSVKKLTASALFISLRPIKKLEWSILFIR